MKILIATKNKGKLREFQKLLKGIDVTLISLNEMPEVQEPVEDGKTFKENAQKKASHYWKSFGINTLAEDSGLEVFALGGRPGVYSARYAGYNATDQQNIEKLLNEMKDIPERQARFVAVLCFIYNGQPYFFEADVRGRIAHEPKGSEGFGYDPVFIPEGYNKTFAELGTEIKNRLSHRARAIEKFKSFLIELLNTIDR